MSPYDSLERGRCTNGSAVRGRGGVREWKGDAGLCKEWPYVFRGPVVGRRFFVVLEAFPLRLDRGGGIWRVEGGVGRRCLARTVRRSGGGRCPLLRLNQLAQLEVFFVSPGIVESVLSAVEFVGLNAVLFRVELLVFFVVVCRWCVVPLSEVLSAKHSTVFKSPGAFGAMDPHGRGSDKQRAFPAKKIGRCR